MPSTIGIVASGHVYPTVTGGTLTSDSTYYYRTFTANGSLVVENASLADVRIFLIGGGGSGAGLYGYWGQWNGVYGSRELYTGAGGGAGGGYWDESLSYSITPQTCAVLVGAGGSSSNGTYSSINIYGTEITAAPGGKGDLYNGGSRFDTSGGTYTYAFVNGSGSHGPMLMGSGGGAGAGSSGTSSTLGGNGGYGYYFMTASGSVGYGGGAGGTQGGYGFGYDYDYGYWAPYFGTSNGANRTEFGSGESKAQAAPVAAPANRGGGGGASTAYAGASGGSGIVVVKYPKTAVGG